MSSTLADQGTRAAPAFGELLKRWRNTRHLSQMDLALAGEVSQRHVSFLESGRANPSREMVLQLAEAMEVPLRERNNLLQSAGFAQVYRQRDLSDPDLLPVRRALELSLKHQEPSPAIVFDREWNVIMSNAAMQRIFSLMGNMDEIWHKVCGDGPPNLLRLTLHPDGMRPFVSNWSDVAQHLMHRVQREAAASGNRDLLVMLDDLLNQPGSPNQWTDYDPGTPIDPVLPLVLQHQGLRLSLFSMISTFGTPQDITTDEIRLEFMFPADEASAQLLTVLAANDAS